jgi:predicted NBD/HSP70 family sugar kinase
LILKSCQITGWDNFPLKDWAEKQWGRPVLIQNDASTAGLAEALHGSGRGHSRIFYMTIGGGVSLMGPLFWNTLRSEVAARAMPSFISSVEIVSAELGEDVVVIGALCL